MNGLKGLKVHEGAIEILIQRSPKADEYARRKCKEIIVHAIKTFHAKERGGKWRPSQTSPPRYVESFEINRRGKRWLVVNFDPGSLWVEFGAHAGGKTLVLKYRPLGTAVDIMAAKNV